MFTPNPRTCKKITLYIHLAKPLERVYSNEPAPKELNAEHGRLVLDAQGNVWTEYMPYTRKSDYMIFTRMSALGEVPWSPKEARSWSGFEPKLQNQFKRYDLWKASYSKAYVETKQNNVESKKSTKTWFIK